MDPAEVQPRALEAPDFVDGLGERTLLTDGASGETIEVLHLRPGLTSVPSFEFALRERSARLANFRQHAFARVRRVDRTSGGLAIASDHVAGFRLSQMLRIAEERALPVDTNAALCLIGQLLPAMALLHENARDVSHGAIAPERLIITPHARLVVAEYVLGSALEQLQLSHDRLWRDYRIPMPPSAGAPRFDHRADVMQVGIASLSLILGRTLQDDELGRIADLLAESTETSAGGARQPLSQGLRGWLARALQLDQRRPFLSARDAQTGLEQLIAVESRFVASTVAVEAFISRCVDSIIEGVGLDSAPAASAPAPAPSAQPEMPRAQEAPAAPVPHAQFDLLRPPEPVRSIEIPRTIEVARMADTPLPHDSAPAMTTPPMTTLAMTAPVVTAPAKIPPVVTAPAVAPHVEATQSEFEDLNALLQSPQSSFGASGTSALFGDESTSSEEPLFQAQARQRDGAPWLRVAAIIVAGLALVGGGVYAARTYFSGRVAAPVVETGTLVVQSTPAGVEVVVDGEAHGVTPARITLKAGPHILELRGRGVPRVMPITMTAGASLQQFVEFAEGSGATTGHLDVRSDPPGARVTVDGKTAGTAPTVVQDLSPGNHTIVLEREGATVQHTVAIEAGRTASLVVPLSAAATGPASGWVSVSAPFAMQIFEDGRLVGTSETDRIMVPAGRHAFDIVNETLGYRETRAVQVQPGKVATLGIELPNGEVNLNAVPWAEVWIDNKRIGETPIGKVSLPMGPHEVVFRHPQFGEKRQAISVTATVPVRLSVDMRK